MTDLALSIVAVGLVVIVATAGLAWGGDRSKFPGRRQGGGTHQNDIEQVEPPD